MRRINLVDMNIDSYVPDSVKNVVGNLKENATRNNVPRDLAILGLLAGGVYGGLSRKRNESDSRLARIARMALLGGAGAGTAGVLRNAVYSNRDKVASVSDAVRGAGDILSETNLPRNLAILGGTVGGLRGLLGDKGHDVNESRVSRAARLSLLGVLLGGLSGSAINYPLMKGRRAMQNFSDKIES